MPNNTTLQYLPLFLLGMQVAISKWLIVIGEIFFFMDDQTERVNPHVRRSLTCVFHLPDNKPNIFQATNLFSKFTLNAV